MDFPPLVKGRLIRRYKRFLADIELESGETITAHVANSGAMTGLNMAGLPAFLSVSNDPARKLKHGLELLEVDDGRGATLVGINTARPNAIVAEAISGGRIAELAGYDSLKREVKYGTNSRIDMLLRKDNHPDCYVEVKNVHLVRQPGLAEFPDAVTARGAKHLAELGNMVEQGHRAVMLYLVHRADCDRFDLARDIDPAYARAFALARQRGVEMLAYACEVTMAGVSVSTAVPVIVP